MLILNRNFRIAANLLIIAVYAVFFFLVDDPWIRVSLVFGFAILIRALTSFGMTSSSDIPLSKRLTMLIVTLVFGSAVFGSLIGALYLTGQHFPSAQPIVKILLIVLMVIAVTKSTFPLGDFSDPRRQNL